MRIKNKLTIGSIFSIILATGHSTISYADNTRFVESTKGVQIKIELASLDNYDLRGSITVNSNDVEKDPAIAGSLSLPMFNPGTLLSHNFPDPYPFFDWQVTLLEAIFSQEHNPFNEFRPYGSEYITIGDPQIFPPLPINYDREIPGEFAFLEIPGLGIIESWGHLPSGSVKKLSNGKYYVKFDTCNFEYLTSDICGIVDFTVSANKEHSSSFTGERVDKFGNENNARNSKYKFKGTFTETTANVEGSVFGIELLPNEPPRGTLKAVISTHRLHNIKRY